MPTTRGMASSSPYAAVRISSDRRPRVSGDPSCRTRRPLEYGSPPSRGRHPRRSAPARLPAATHAGAAGGRARAGTIRLGFALRAHLVEIRLARRLTLRAFRALAAGAIGQALVVERDAHLVELGLVHLAARAAAPSARALSFRGGVLRGGIVHHRHLGGAQALDLVAQARGLLEVEIGGSRAHAGF